MAQEKGNEIIQAFEKGDADKLETFLHDMVDLKLPGYTGTYSRNQAGIILETFYELHPVASFRQTGRGQQENMSEYFMADMTSGKNTYNIYCVIGKSGGVQHIIHIRIKEIKKP
jgi:hypothetical protein